MTTRRLRKRRMKRCVPAAFVALIRVQLSPDHSLTKVAGWHRTRKASRNTKFVIATVRGRKS